MTSLYKSFEVDQNSNFYEISVNDGGPDGGSNYYFRIFGETMLDPEDLDAAILSFANTIVGSNSAFSLVSVNKVGVTETTI